MNLRRRLHPLLPELLRFGIVGLVATATHAAVYGYLVSRTSVAPLAANPVAFALAFLVSFFGHRDWTFAHQAAKGALPKFLATALLGFCSNQFITWLVVDQFHLPALDVIYGIFLVTPILVFICSKYWAFAAPRQLLEILEDELIPHAQSLQLAESTGPRTNSPNSSVSPKIIDRIAGRARDLGGFSVRRVLPIGHRKLVGPFIFFDEMGPVNFAPGTGMDVRPHPHIGLATVTYLFTGRMHHRDSLGTVQAIEPGAVNWMTAGRGIVHSERSTPQDRADGIAMHGIQSWVALPRECEECAPSFVHHPADALPRVELPGAQLRIIAGHAFGAQSPVITASPTFYVEALCEHGAMIKVPNDYAERAIYPVDQPIEIDGETHSPGSLMVLAADADVTFSAPQGGRVMLLGGAKLDGERYIDWNFVSSRPERIEQAKADWAAQRFAPVPGETEFIPLPVQRA
jgi:redox-sensitive bicupin YhaK (pirin superfamily)/putative flippase GtrA